MIECLILGDSIATGVDLAFHKECRVSAEVGITSSRFISKYGSTFQSKQVIISLGSNDANDPSIQLDVLRGGIDADEVVWLVPERHKDVILEIARRYKDKVLMINDFDMSKDKIHPTGKGYYDISNRIKKGA